MFQRLDCVLSGRAGTAPTPDAHAGTCRTCTLESAGSRSTTDAQQAPAPPPQAPCPAPRLAPDEESSAQSQRPAGQAQRPGPTLTQALARWSQLGLLLMTRWRPLRPRRPLRHSAPARPGLAHHGRRSRKSQARRCRARQGRHRARQGLHNTPARRSRRCFNLGRRCSGAIRPATVTCCC